MNAVTSKDGTTIAYDKLGQGPAVILVSGASTTRGSNEGLAALLAEKFTVFNYDRRGRGDSGDILPFAVEREIEDIAAVLAEAGGSARLYGTSSGAVLALRATASGLNVRKLAMWEPPFATDENFIQRYRDYNAKLAELIAADRRGDAIEHFMTFVGMPPDFITFARSQPWWPGQETLAHTLAYDAAAMGDGSVPVALAAAVNVPTLVLTGGASPAFMHDAARVLINVLPNGKTRSLPDQQHNVAPEALAPVLSEFFAA